jgi:hypothetical protein
LRLIHYLNLELTEMNKNPSRHTTGKNRFKHNPVGNYVLSQQKKEDRLLDSLQPLIVQDRKERAKEQKKKEKEERRQEKRVQREQEELRSAGNGYINIERGKEIRCPYCNKLFCKGHAAPGSALEFKCLRNHCRKISRFMVI